MKYMKVLLTLCPFVGCSPSSARAQAATIALVQHTNKDAGTATSATLAFNSNNTAGNWIGVCIRAGHSGQVFTVTDSKGNAYNRAVQFNVTVDTPNGNTLGIFYAENIAGGANTITVSDTISGTLRFAIVEHSGVAVANSLDVIAMAQGNGVSPDSGNATTTSSGDLLLGAISTANSASFTAGSGFSTVESVPGEPGTKLLAEQQIRTIAGTESTHASLGASDSWGAVLAGFKGGGGAGTKPNITSLNPASGVMGTSVTITGTNFGTTLGTVAFNGTAGTPTNWSTTRIVVPVPSGANTGNVVVTDLGVPSNGVAFTVTSPDTTPPVVTITSPANNATISGTTTITASATDNVAVASVQFKVDNANAGAALVSAPYRNALDTTMLSDGNHILTAVATDTSGNATTSTAVTVTVNNTVAAPSITNLNPTSGLVDTSVTITGTNFGVKMGTVTFNGTPATPTSWSAASIVVPVPTGATTGNVVVTTGGVASNGVGFALTSSAPMALVQHTSKDAGTTTSATVAFNSNNTAGNWIGVCIRAGHSGQVFTVTDSKGNAYNRAVQFNVSVDAPIGDALGIYYAENIVGGANAITVSDTISGTLRFAIVEYSGVAVANSLDVIAMAQGNGVSPDSGNATTTSSGDLLLGAISTANSASFTAGSGNAIRESVAAEPKTKLMVEDQTQATAGSVSASASLGAADTWGAGMAAFKSASGGGVTKPSITSVNPTSGSVGTSVTIAGANFGANQGTRALTFNRTTATPTSWSAASIVVAVPSGATTGNVVVTAGGVASNGVSFMVVTDTTAPVVTITAPANSANVSGTITLTATATDPDSPVSFVQFQVDGANLGAQLTAAPYSSSLDTPPLPNGPHTLTAIAADPSGNQGTSAPANILVTNTTGSTMGPLVQSTTNPHYFVDKNGKAVALTGSHTWNDFQDTDTSGSPAAFDFNSYTAFLKAHGQNATVLWRQDLPQFCQFPPGGVWKMTPWPWQRTGPGNASDGNPRFDLTQFNQAYFDRLRQRVIQLEQNNIYAIVELFGGEWIGFFRCGTASPAGDGYPLTDVNNVNGVNDGYTSGSNGSVSITTATPNTFTTIQVAYMKKVVDTLNDLPNVLWEIDEESVTGTENWHDYVISQLRSYEATEPNQHPVGYTTMRPPGDDTGLLNSNADWIAPILSSGGGNVVSPVNNCGTGTPACKIILNDSDHAFYYPYFLNSDGSVQNQKVRNYIWGNFTAGSSVLFMDPYEFYWPINNRNFCTEPVNGICSAVDTKYDAIRNAMGYVVTLTAKLDLVKMTPQNSLTSTTWCLANNTAVGAEFVVYAATGGTFTVNLSTQSGRTLVVEWLNPATGATSSGGMVSGGSSAESFTPPFSGDAVLYIVDAAGHN